MRGNCHVAESRVRRVRGQPQIPGPAARCDRPGQGCHLGGIVLGARRPRYAGQQTGAGADAGGGGRRRRGCDRAVRWRETHQSWGRVCQHRDDLRRRQVGHFSDADPPRHGDPAGGSRGGGGDRRFGPSVSDRGCCRLRSHGADGRRVHSDGDVARLSRRSGVRHLRRRDCRRQTRGPRCEPDQRRDRPMRQSRCRQSRRRAQRRPFTA